MGASRELSPSASGVREPEGFVRVTRERFLATVGPMDVHPRVDISTFRDPPTRSDWESPYRVRHGVSYGHGDDAAWFVSAAISKALGGAS